ncbi:trypsin-like peptidase domain-containing protein [Chloroflexi bacterium TSY]|nr:trypsin-like peptidase domain-containing protein [Chloroflexi bacterium TSY]
MRLYEFFPRYFRLIVVLIAHCLIFALAYISQSVATTASAVGLYPQERIEPQEMSTPTTTSTANRQATANAVETAVAATLEALKGPTSTPDLISARLTEIAVATTTARVRISTPTRSLTKTPPRLIFSTPRPVRTEEAFAPDSVQIPSGFPGIESYHGLRASTVTTDLLASSVNNSEDASKSVVQILRCEGDFGCDNPAGTGIIVHSTGLILTAYHVLLEDPNDLLSPLYREFVIALTEDVFSKPRPTYRAKLVAQKVELDIALLAIDRRLDESDIEHISLNLPALPFADISRIFGASFDILGYPQNDGDAINHHRASFGRFDEDGQLIVVDSLPGKGNSGGPALMLQDGRMTVAGFVIRGRSTQGQPGQSGLLRTINQVIDLTWTPRFNRVVGQNIQIVERSSDGEDLLQISIDLSTFDLGDVSLRLLFYMIENGTGQPWQPPDSDGPLVIWTDLNTEKFIDAQTIVLTSPVEKLGMTPDRLSFYGMLWDRENGRSMWANVEDIQMKSDPVAIAPVAGETRRPTATRTPTPSPTRTLRPTMTPTVNIQATNDAVETAAAATLEALYTPTPTTDRIAARLTEVAMETATMRAMIPTATRTPTNTRTLRPTSTIMPTPTETLTLRPTNRPRLRTNPSDVWTGEPPDYILILTQLRPRVDPPPIIIHPIVSSDNESIILSTSGTACLNFDDQSKWGSEVHRYKLWDDQYQGWVPFAVDDGGLYGIENVGFMKESTIKAGEYSFRLTSTDPYVAGLSSPLIPVNEGDEVTATVHYYIWEHGQAPQDWVALGVKPDAYASCEDDCYVNGFTRGRWAKLSKTVIATGSEIMILLQAQSPQNLNSNIYFDELEIRINGKFIDNCRYHEDF